MSGNIFGRFLRLTTFGESHGKYIGGVIDGFPPGVSIDFALISQEMQRRRPGHTSVSSPRKEDDFVEFLSGLQNGKTTGAPIAFLIKNKDAKPSDYQTLGDVFRPSHADYTYFKKYGAKPISGGGRASARETAARVAAGAIAKCLLKNYGISILAYTSGVGEIDLQNEPKDLSFKTIESNAVRCPDPVVASKMEELIVKTSKEGDSLGGRINCVISGIIPGIGEPVFEKLQAMLAQAMLTIPAVKGFEYGSGFSGSYMKGSEHNDEFVADENGNISTQSNFSGGIQGGISNGNDIYFRVAFKPVSSIKKKQKTVDIAGKNREIQIEGRHDSCVVPRAVAIVEAMAALVIADYFLIADNNRNRISVD